MHLSVRYYYAKQLVQVVNAVRYIINIAEKTGRLLSEVA